MLAVQETQHVAKMELGFQISARTRGKGEPCTGRCTRPHLNTGAGSATSADANVSATDVATGRDQYRFLSAWCNGKHPEASESPEVVTGHCEAVGITNAGSNPAALTIWPVAQSEEQWTHNPLVTGSSPVRPTNFRGCTGFDFTSASTVACRGCLVCRVTNRGENQLPRILVATAVWKHSGFRSLPTVPESRSRKSRSLPDAEQVAGGGRRELPLIKHVDTVGVLMEDGGSTPPTSTTLGNRNAGRVPLAVNCLSRPSTRAAGHCDSVTQVFAVSGHAMTLQFIGTDTKRAGSQPKRGGTKRSRHVGTDVKSPTTLDRVAQRTEHPPSKRGVEGSIPSMVASFAAPECKRPQRKCSAGTATRKSAGLGAAFTLSPPRSAGFVEGPVRRTSRVRCDGTLEPGRGGFFHGQRRVSAQVVKIHESVTNRAAGHCESVTEIFAVSGVEGHSDAGLSLSLFYSAPSSRYQSRPDCNSISNSAHRGRHRSVISSGGSVW